MPALSLIHIFFILLFFQPAEGFDYSFLTLRSAPVFRDALHAVVQIAALGDCLLYTSYGGGTAQGYNHFRPDDPDLLNDDGQARLNFFRRGGAGIGSLVGQGRAEFDDVGNVNHVSGESHSP